MSGAFNIRYPASGGSNPSVGVTGATAPTSATEIAGVDSGGDLIPIKVDSAGVVQVNITGGIANPLPVTDAAAEASLASLDGKTTVVNTNSVTVVASALPTGAATATLQTSGNATLTTIASNQTNGSQVTSVNSSALPTGGSTSALQSSTQGSVTGGTAATASTLSGGIFQSSLPTLTNNQQSAIHLDNSGRQIVVSPGVPVALGQQAAAASLGVTLSNEDVQDLYVTGQSGQSATVNNVLTAVAGSAATDLTGYRWASVQVVSTAIAGTYILEGSNDNVNFVSLSLTNQATFGGALRTAITATVSSIVYTFPIVTRYVRLRIATTITGGGATIQAFSKFSQVSFAATTQVVTQDTGANLVTSAMQNGTWTVQPGNTPNTVAWLFAQKTPTAGTVTQAAITVGTSAVRATVSGSAPSATRSVLVITVDAASTAKFYIGSSGVTNTSTTRGIQIIAGQPVSFSNDAGDYYIISDTAAQTVYVMEQA